MKKALKGQDVGTSLRVFRAKRHWTQAAAAEHFGISHSYWCLIEARKRIPRPTIAKRLSDEIGIPLDVLLFS